MPAPVTAARCCFYKDATKTLQTYRASMQVKRATGLPKMKKFLEDRTAVFKLDTDSGMAALA